MPNLKNIHIKFHTYNDNLNGDTDLHVFVKNRRAAKIRGDSASTSLGATSFIDNKLSFDAHNEDGTSEFNPFLGFKENVSGGNEFENDSDHEFDIPLQGRTIPLEEVVLPVVNIHILPEDNDRWIFDYTITFTFDDGRSFSSSSNVNGVSGIILDQDNKDYAGICIENPFIPLPAAPRPDTDALLTRLVIEFATHNDNKNSDTKVNVHVVNRTSATSSQDISVATDLFSGQEFEDPSYHSIDLPLSSPNIRLQDIVLPEVNINIGQNDEDRWIFDYRVTFFFTDKGSLPPGVFREPFSSTTTGVILDQDHHKHTGVYTGRPFPTFNSPMAPLVPFAIDHAFHPKSIPLSFIQKKLDDFVNNRNSVPLKRIRFHNTGRFGDPLPESYVDLKSIDADPPAPRTVEPPTFNMGVKYNSAPSSLGQLKAALGLGDLYLNDINSQTLTATVDAGSVTPFKLVVDFETGGPDETVGGGTLSVSGMDFLSFSITVLLTLRFDEPNGRVDLMGWIDDINSLTYTPQGNNIVRVTGSFLGKPIDTLTSTADKFRSDLIGEVLDVRVVTSSSFDPGGSFQKSMRERLFSRLSTKDPITKVTPRDALNATINSWFMGGTIESGNTSLAPFPNTCRLVAAKVEGDNLVLNYIGPPNSFVYQAPADWPTQDKPNPKFDFSPGTLANIDHIVVLTMENRSFDHMLGYLSLPESMGGQNRKDVDGLKGNETNLLNGKVCPIFRLKPGETIFAPDPPHDTEPVSLAINGGRMDGFAQSYANLRGNVVGPNIMAYHTADTLPVYDALARDFAIGNRYFAAHPGPTFCNRFYELTGRLNIDPWGFWEYSNSSPLRPVFTDTIFDHLTDHGVSWKYFEHFYCFLRFFERHTYDSTNIVSFDDPVKGFESLARSGNLPSVSYIDPHFIELPPNGNCDGPPADVKEGQKLVQRIVNAVVTGPKWSKTLLIVTYDEHGGFFDHVPPSAAAKVSPELLGTHGVRVPAFLITPWVKNGSVFGRDSLVVHGGVGGIDTTHEAVAIADSTGSPTPAPGHGSVSVAATGAVSEAERSAAAEHTEARVTPFQSVHYDHTSILKTIARRFMSSSPPYMGARYAAANDFSQVLTNTPQNSQFLPFIPYRLAYGKLNLTVQGASTSAGAALIQIAPDGTPSQDFRFEDAGDGFFFIRTLAGKYLTVDVPPGTNTGPGTTLHVKQDVKYADGSAAHNRDFQRWKLVSGGVTVLDRNIFTVSCAAFPQKTLQPTGNSANPGTAIAIGDPTPVHFGTMLHNPWHVTSPLLGSDDQVLTTA